MLYGSGFMQDVSQELSEFASNGGGTLLLAVISLVSSGLLMRITSALRSEGAKTRKETDRLRQDLSGGLNSLTTTIRDENEKTRKETRDDGAATRRSLLEFERQVHGRRG